MINDEIPEEINSQLNETLGITSDDETDGYTPMYRIFGADKIPVSKSEGKLWHNRLKQCNDVMKDVTDQWDITYKYFNADQITYKEDGNIEFKTSKLRNKHLNSENLVWANNTSLVPSLYSQNPTVEITTNKRGDENSEKTAQMVERLINVLFNKRTNPGVNLKNKARKGILNTLLTNRGIIKIGYTFKVDSIEQSIKDIQNIANQLENAKDVKEVEELEGKLQALDTVVAYSSQSGPFVKHIKPFDLFIDPNAQDQDGSDANWIMEREWIPTEYLKAKFGKENGEDVESLYKPGKVLPINSKGEDDNDDALTLYDDKDNAYEAYGYDNLESFKRNCLTECYWVWDKLKKRVYLYSDNCWEYPIWVWNDPYQLEEFYPYYILNFHESPNGTLCKGETSYYLDQQDTINMINAQLQKMREFGFNKYLFDKNSGMEIEDIQKWLNGKRDVVGISLPPNKKFEEILFEGQIPYDKNQQLYDKSDLFRTVDMVCGTDSTTRSGEYKTNTTNLAIQSYIAGKSIKLDDKRDQIEQWIGNIAWGIAQLCLMNMEQETVIELIGETAAQFWENMDSKQITSTYSVNCVGGTTVKPTSDTKQQQALQISQVLGQFASASPYVSIVMLQILQRAFDNAAVNEEDIEMVKNSILQQLQAQMMQQQQAAMLQSAQANAANAEAAKGVAESANIMQAMNGLPADLQQQSPDMLLNGE